MNLTEHSAAKAISNTVLQEYSSKIDDDRLRTLITGLLEHLHSFAQDVGLTEPEWAYAMDFLARTGQRCDGKRQEFILLSDVLGFSMVVDALHTDTGGLGTENTVLGPFHVDGAPDVPYGGSVIRTDEPQGEVVLIRGRVVDPSGQGVSRATIHTWSTGGNAAYFMQDDDAPAFNMYGVQTTLDDGRYCFISELPVSYTIPSDGPVGELLRATNRKDIRPAHIHFIVAAEMHQTLQTHLFADDDPHLEADVVFALKEELIVHFEKSSDPELAAQFGLPENFRILNFDFVLVPEAMLAMSSV